MPAFNESTVADQFAPLSSLYARNLARFWQFPTVDGKALSGSLARFKTSAHPLIRQPPVHNAYGRIVR